MSLVWHSSFHKESISQLLHWFWKVLSWQLELKMNFIRCYRKEQGPSSTRDTSLHTEEVPLSLPFTPHWHQMKSLKVLTCIAYFLWKFACPHRVCIVFFLLSVLLRQPFPPAVIWGSLCWADLDREVNSGRRKLAYWHDNTLQYYSSTWSLSCFSCFISWRFWTWLEEYCFPFIITN